MLIVCVDMDAWLTITAIISALNGSDIRHQRARLPLIAAPDVEFQVQQERGLRRSFDY